nr:hypothetical protein CFP56_17178 [Quercus suber]
MFATVSLSFHLCLIPYQLFHLLSTQIDGKKVGGHIAIPHPSKKSAKTPATSEQSKQKSPKSASSFSCQTYSNWSSVPHKGQACWRLVTGLSQHLLL